MTQTLSQTQIIRSLGQALEWFEKEVGWGVSPAELNHLTGRIGELYAAMITRGQMALATNQKGYDIVSLEGEYISVKTVTSSNHVTFNASTFDIVDRVIVLRIVIEDDSVSIEEIEDCPADQIRQRKFNKDGKYSLAIRPPKQAEAKTNATRTLLSTEELKKLKITGIAIYKNHRVLQFENATILVETDGVVCPITRPILREIARDIGVDALNTYGNLKNTRSLGADIIKALS